jgi:intracellular septation protein
MKGFFFGTKLLVLATPLALIAAYVRDRRFAVFPFLCGVFVLLLGGATLFFHDPRFIQLEYTLYNGLLGLLLLVSLVLKKLPLKYMFDSMLGITDRGWEILSLRFGVMLMMLAFFNQIILHFHAIEFWVYYRFFAYIFSTLFGLSQAWLTRRCRLPDASPWGLRI